MAGWMRVGLLVVVLVSAGLFPGNEAAQAQSQPGNVQALPPIVVSRTAPNPKPGRARHATRTVTPAAPTVVLYPTTPIPGSGIDVDKVPASVSMVDVNQIEQAHSANIAVALQQYVPSIIVNEVSGNPFQPSVQFRGFAREILGGPSAGGEDSWQVVSGQWSRHNGPRMRPQPADWFCRKPRQTTKGGSLRSNL